MGALKILLQNHVILPLQIAVKKKKKVMFDTYAFSASQGKKTPNKPTTKQNQN